MPDDPRPSIAPFTLPSITVGTDPLTLVLAIMHNLSEAFLIYLRHAPPASFTKAWERHDKQMERLEEIADHFRALFKRPPPASAAGTQVPPSPTPPKETI